MVYLYHTTTTPTAPLGQPGVSCDFEKDLCGYSPVTASTGTLKWIRNSASTSSSNTGPTFDHTYRASKGQSSMKKYCIS